MNTYCSKILANETSLSNFVLNSCSKIFQEYYSLDCQSIYYKLHTRNIFIFYCQTLNSCSTIFKRIKYITYIHLTLLLSTKLFFLIHHDDTLMTFVHENFDAAFKKFNLIRLVSLELKVGSKVNKAWPQKIFIHIVSMVCRIH